MDDQILPYDSWPIPYAGARVRSSSECHLHHTRTSRIHFYMQLVHNATMVRLHLSSDVLCLLSRRFGRAEYGLHDLAFELQELRSGGGRENLPMLRDKL